MQVSISLDSLAGNLLEIERRSVNLLPVMQAGRIMAVSEVQRRFQTGTDVRGASWPPLRFPRPSGGNPKPLLNNGLLRASITGAETQESITVGTNAVQANLMHFGGTVRPKKGRFLAIPMTVEATRVAGPRVFPGRLRAIVRRGARGGVLRDEAGKVQFLLVRSAEIPARPFMGFSDVWQAKFRVMLIEYLVTGRF